MSKLPGDRYPDYDPEGVGHPDGGLFGFPYSEEESALMVCPVPWDVTASYGKGTAGGPEAILEASSQLDFYHPDLPEFWKVGAYMSPISKQDLRHNGETRKFFISLSRLLEDGKGDAEGARLIAQRIDEDAEVLFASVQETLAKWLDQDKLPVLLGGEHSCSIPFLRELASRHDSFGILQLDAHADLRDRYMGLQHSHASIMHNALALPSVKQLVQVGVRDWAASEQACIDAHPERIHCWFQHHLDALVFSGMPWTQICDDIVAQLPAKVYITVDIDGLDPSLCPHTGTPVPGGLSFAQATYLIRQVVASGRTIIGCDLVEVGAEEWDGNVGARMLMHLMVHYYRSNRS